jgi:hypothetical protein
MKGLADGMVDILPPVAVHDGLAALLAPASDSPGWLLLALVLLMICVSLVVMRRRMRACLRLWQAVRASMSGKPAPEIATQIERLLRQQFCIHLLHPEHTPQSVDSTAWRALIGILHAARFSTNPVGLSTIQPLLTECFSPCKSDVKPSVRP